MIKSSRQFIVNNPGILLSDGLALYFSIVEEDELAVMQLLREYETSYPVGYGKQVLNKTLAFLPEESKNWLRSLV